MHEPSQAAPSDRLERMRDYFGVFLPALRGRLLIEDLHELSTCVEIAVSDAPDPPWRLAIANGRLVEAERATCAPRCRFVLDAATMLEVVRGQVTPAEAFFAQRIDVVGDLEEGLRLSTVLEPFFRRFPYDG